MNFTFTGFNYKMPGGDGHNGKYENGHSKRQKKQKWIEKARRPQGAILGFFTSKGNDNPSLCGP